MTRLSNKRLIMVIAALFTLSFATIVILSGPHIRSYNSDRVMARHTYLMLTTTSNSTAPTIPTALSHTAKLCKALPCVEALSEVDRNNFNTCTTRAARKIGSIKPSECGFIPAYNNPPVPLASFPGSGNTWVRGLLQKATGICTGTMYCDHDLRAKGFPGEGITSGSVLAVKTHYLKPITTRLDLPPDRKAVVLLRNPFDAFVAEHSRAIQDNLNIQTQNFTSSCHLVAAGKEHFGHSESWMRFLQYHTKWWLDIIRYWIVYRVELHGPPLVIKYEDMKADPVAEVAKILRYLNMERSIDEIASSLKGGFDSYKRSRHSNITYYLPQQVAHVNMIIHQAQHLLNVYKVDINLESYLRRSKE